MNEKNLTNAYECEMKILTMTVNGQEVNIAPITSTRAVRDENGKTLEAVLKEINSSINDAIRDELDKKVDKEEGMGLSERSFTTAEKNKLKGIEENANNYVHPDNENTRHVSDSLIEKWNEYEDSKVDVVPGMGLSQQNFTTEEKEKLKGIAANANNYSHPTGDGNTHVPANGNTNGGKVLKATATPGVYEWSNIEWSDITGRPSEPVGIQVSNWAIGTGEDEDLFYAIVEHQLDTKILNVVAFGADNQERFIALETIDNRSFKIWTDTQETITVFIKQF